MFARVARYDVPAERADDAVESFRHAAEAIARLPGLTTAYVMVDHESGTVATVTVWESRQAMEASEVRASRARQEAVGAVGGDCISVDRLAIVAELPGGPG